ncbi:MAG TPA: 4-alpha-glucanotransferase [Acidimicrobiales bacterium]|nr:4-alpha-glucanotransferase [Acidimicrobiales bacterium]
MDAAAWGIEPGYHDYRGEWRETRPETADALLQAMGADSLEPPQDDAIRFARPGDHLGPSGPAELLTEDGGSAWLDDGRLPSDTPFGYHTLRADDAETALVVSPGQCFLPDGLRTWGWAVQLYAARSEESWGIGDLADLRRLAQWSAGQGAGMLLLNPLHASLPTVQVASPYFPSSRCFRNPVYLRVDGPVPPEAKALNAERVIDRDAVWRLKGPALEAAFSVFSGDAAFARFTAEGGDVLTRYAVFCALAEVYDGPWTEWPDGLHDPASSAVARFAAERADRVRFHMWLQWQVDRQLAEAGGPLDLMQDLAIGCDPRGADAWLWQDAFALGVRVGAPPDEFNRQGQDWGLPPFNPWRLRAAGYEPFIRTMRAGLRHAGGLRVDHVMGLFRLFWIPPDVGPSDGAYVRYPYHELLDILALESHRAGAYVVGEDLGTVADFMREELARRNVLSYRLLWFEPEPPPRFPERALAAVTTHDLPTVAGMWTGADLAELERLGLDPNVASTRAIHERLQHRLGLPPDAPVADVVVGAHALLAQAPSAVVTATLDDALLVEERPNVPGTTDERPNWSLALPKTIEEIEVDPLVAQVADALKENRSGTSRAGRRDTSSGDASTST